MPCLSYLLAPVLSCMCVLRTFLRLVLTDVVSLRPRKFLKMSAILCLRSSFMIQRSVFLIVLLVSFFVWLSFGVELREVSGRFGVFVGRSCLLGLLH